MNQRDDFRVCSCIALDHPLHKPGRCDEPPDIRGGVCHTCRVAIVGNPPKEGLRL
jgi:hypothetical protein